jgi:ATP-dependent Clp protease adaptor protein ClpS
MVGVAQLVERWLVVPDVAGSSPVIHPMSSSAGPRSADPAVEESIAIREETAAPWVTIVWNDPVNLMSYVTYVFRSYFGFPRTEAERLMLLVHHEGRAVVATGARDEMERHVEAMHGYGLWATVSKADT